MMTPIADVFRENPAPKEMARRMSKNPSFRGPLDRQHGKFVGTLLQSEWKHLCNIYETLCRQVGLKKFLLVIHKIQRLFVNTLTTDDKHYLLNRDILAQRIQMQLSQKQKTFSEFFFAFLKSILNFKHLPKNDDPHS